MAEPTRPKAAETPGSDDESTVFLPTQSNAGVSEAEHLAAAPARAAAAQREAARKLPRRWMAVVALVLLSVPMLRECSKGRQLARAATAVGAAQAAAAAASANAEAEAAIAQPAVPPAAEPPPARPPGVEITRPQGQAPPSMTGGSRQTVTKCIERGRVVYSQTGECAGSVTAVPIDADKNVVGTERPATEGAGKKAP